MTALQKNDLKSFINQKDATGVFKKEGIEGEARRKEKKGKKKKKRGEKRPLCTAKISGYHCIRRKPATPALS